MSFISILEKEELNNLMKRKKMKNKINELKPKWMDVYHEGKSVGCKCKNCFTRFGKSGSLSLKQREHFGTLIPHSYYTENDKS